MFLPKPPKVIIRTLKQEKVSPGFLSIDRRDLQFIYEDKSDLRMTIDCVNRKSNDAVVILAHYNDPTLGRHIYLRSSIRPALAIRDYQTDSNRPEQSELSSLWELPAGLIDANEQNTAGIFTAAARELSEEVGYKVSVHKFKLLGGRVFTAVGLCAERLYFLEVEVDPSTKGTPSEDGSALEHGGVVIPVPLAIAKISIEQGTLFDAKTEIGITRLLQKYPL